MSYRQFLLLSGDTHLMTWLEDDKRLVSGARLTIKGHDEVWTVAERYSQLSDDPPRKDWKVGGLD